MRCVIMESPYAGRVERNIRYAKAAIRDCLHRGEAPIASHLLFPQQGILDDNVLHERTLGIGAGFAWYKHAECIVFYVDLGWSSGMSTAREFTARMNVLVEERQIGWNEP